MTLGLFMIMLDSAVVNVALPSNHHIGLLLGIPHQHPLRPPARSDERDRGRGGGDRRAHRLGRRVAPALARTAGVERVAALAALRVMVRAAVAQIRPPEAVAIDQADQEHADHAGARFIGLFAWAATLTHALVRAHTRQALILAARVYLGLGVLRFWPWARLRSRAAERCWVPPVRAHGGRRDSPDDAAPDRSSGPAIILPLHPSPATGWLPRRPVEGLRPSVRDPAPRARRSRSRTPQGSRSISARPEAGLKGADSWSLGPHLLPRCAVTRPGGRTLRFWLPPWWGSGPRGVRRSRASNRRRRRGPSPIRNRTFTGAVATIALAGAAYFGMLVYLSLFLQGTQKYGAIQAGLVYLPTILPYMIISPLAGRLVAHVSGAPLPTIGAALMACGMLLLVGIDEGAGLLDVTGGMAVAGLGTGLMLTPLTQLAIEPSVDRAQRDGIRRTADLPASRCHDRRHRPWPRGTRSDGRGRIQCCRRNRSRHRRRGCRRSSDDGSRCTQDRKYLRVPTPGVTRPVAGVGRERASSRRRPAARARRPHRSRRRWPAAPPDPAWRARAATA